VALFIGRAGHCRWRQAKLIRGTFRACRVRALAGIESVAKG